MHKRAGAAVVKKEAVWCCRSLMPGRLHAGRLMLCCCRNQFLHWGYQRLGMGLVRGTMSMDW